MVLVQLFIIKIALSNWVAPVIPFLFVITTLQNLLCHNTHTRTHIHTDTQTHVLW